MPFFRGKTGFCPIKIKKKGKQKKTKKQQKQIRRV